MSQDDVLFGYRLQLFDLAGRIGVSSQVPGRGVTRRQDRGLLRPW